MKKMIVVMLLVAAAYAVMGNLAEKSATDMLDSAINARRALIDELQ